MKTRARQFLTDTALMLVGSFLIAVAVNGFLRPNGFLSGGMAGTSLIIYYNWPGIPIPFSVLFLIINIPVFALGYFIVGKKFIIFSVWAVLIHSTMFQFVTPAFEVADDLLCAIVGGILSGVGLALILRTNGTSSGTEIISIIVNKFYSINLSVTNMVMNAILLMFAGAFLPLDKVLYSFVFIIMNALAMNGVFKALAKRKAVMIMSRRWEEILKALNESEVRIGVTLLDAKGGFTGTEDPLIYSIVRSSHVSVLRRAAMRIDPAVFIVVTEAAEIIHNEVGNQPPWKKQFYK